MMRVQGKFLALATCVSSALSFTGNHLRRLTRLASTSPEYNSHFEYKNLPEETIYVMDASGLIFQTYYSPVRSLSARNSNFSKHFSSLCFGNLNGEDAFESTQISNVCSTVVDITNNFVGFVRQVNPRYIAVVFDSGRNTFRKEQFPEYKSQRKETPKELSPVFYIMPIILQALGANVFMVPGYEADDIMATVGKWSHERGLNVVHVSDDQDMLQLISPGVHVMKRRSKALLGEQDVVNKFGVLPSKICDLRALSGDKADNINGIKGIGLKIGSALIRHFGSAELIKEAIQNCASAEELDLLLSEVSKNTRTKMPVLKLIRSLREDESLKAMLMYKQLLMLRDNIPVPGINCELPSDHKHLIHNQPMSVFPPEKQSRFTTRARKSLEAASRLTTADFRYRGEEVDVVETLSSISPDLVSAISVLRQSYSSMDRLV